MLKSTLVHPGSLTFSLLLGVVAGSAVGCALDVGGAEESVESAVAADTEAPVGAVYVASNQYAGNEILSFLRRADGTLVPGPRTATLGRGSGPSLVVANDPLGSQGSLVADEAQQRLFAVNAGSDQVSVLSISSAGLTLTDLHASRGQFPVSLTVAGNTLYVLNALSNSIAGFRVRHDGTLEDLQTCALPASAPFETLPATPTSSVQPVATQTPGQIGFSPDGKKLVIVAKEGPMLAGFPFGATLGSGRIHVYGVDRDGRLKNCGSPTTTSLPRNQDGRGKFPFSFTWGASGELVVTEVFATGTSPLAPAASALASFALGQDGSLTPIAEVPSGEVAVCWVVRSGRYVYAANYLSNSLSSYDDKKRLELMLGNAAGLGAGSTPVDMAVTTNGRFLYQLTPGTGEVQAFVVDRATGALTALAPAGDGTSWDGYMGLATANFAE